MGDKRKLQRNHGKSLNPLRRFLKFNTQSIKSIDTFETTKQLNVREFQKQYEQHPRKIHLLQA